MGFKGAGFDFSSVLSRLLSDRLLLITVRPFPSIRTLPQFHYHFLSRVPAFGTRGLGFPPQAVGCPPIAVSYSWISREASSIPLE